MKNWIFRELCKVLKVLFDYRTIAGTIYEQVLMTGAMVPKRDCRDG